MSQPFGEDAYATLTGSQRSASIVLPIAFDLLGVPASVVDFGCGIGGWLAAARDLGVSDYLGLEGGHPEPGTLRVAADHVRQVDLEHPVDLGRRFDLAVCVEVAEHLPDSLAGQLVASIGRHTDAAVWSAAIEGQGGIGHINERNPPYWHALWQAEGFECFDVLRWAVWEDRQVAAWFRQNVLLYARGGAADRLRGRGLVPVAPPTVVHPALYERVVYLLTERHPKRLRRHAREAVWSLRHRADRVERPDLDWPL